MNDISLLQMSSDMIKFVCTTLHSTDTDIDNLPAHYINSRLKKVLKKTKTG